MAFSSQAQQETQKAALRYERAVSMHNAAREMVFVAEQGVMADKNRLDPTWQEMLNHATCKVSPVGPAVPLPSCLSFAAVLPIILLTPSCVLRSSLPSAITAPGTTCPCCALCGPQTWPCDVLCP